MAKLLPLNGKYYGTIVKLNDGATIEIWLPSGIYEPSERELAEGWTQEHGYDHVENSYSFRVAKIIEKALNDNGL